MGLVATWLNGIGLSHAIPSFQAAGIVTPQALAELDLEHYVALGVTEADDRRKLFYLVQRIKMAQDRGEDESEMSNQQQVDEVFSKSLGNKTVDDVDSMENDDGAGVPEPKKSTRRASARLPSKSVTQNATSASTRPVSKENRRPASKPADTTAARGRTSLSGTRPSRKTKATRASAAVTKARTKKKILMDDDDFEEEDEDKDDDSDWEGDEMSSGEEDPIPSSRSQRRMSSRLREKEERRESSASTQPPSRNSDDDSSVTSASSRLSRSSLGSQSSIPRPRRQSAGAANLTRGRRSSLSDDRRESSGDDSSAASGQRARNSAMPQPRTGRFQSKIHNPGASKRTGKQLSTIPSDTIAPMSPLVSLPASRMDADIRKQREREERQANAKTVGNGAGKSTRQRASSLDRTSQSGSDSDRSTSRRRKSLSSSDSETTSRKAPAGRKSLGGASCGRQSASSATSRSRRSMGGNGSRRPDMSSLQKPQSLRDLAVNGSSENEVRTGRRSLPAVSGRPRESEPLFVHGMAADDSWAAQVSQLREDNDAEHELFSGSMLNNDDEEMRIRVIIRKRPMSKNESASGKEVDVIHPLEYDSYGKILAYQPKTRVDLTKEIETVPFAFDNVFNERSNNVQIYKRAVRNLIPGVFEGRWASVFAYGQTGSGKTYTMMGSNLTGINAGNATDDEENLGLYYMAALDVFEMANDPSQRHLRVGASLFEIYSGKLFDLLNGRKPIKCLEDHRGKVCFPGLSEHPVESARELMDVIETGALNRSTGTTSKNADSSRSHAVLQLSLRKDIGKQKNVEHGRLTFIDLAGSERGADTSKASRTTRLEGAEINTSLLALKEVIRALATGDSMAHIPFRGSKLTQVLKESFVGKRNSSVMVACIAPNLSNCEHTLNTLRYADRVKERDSETGLLPEGVTHRKHEPSSRLPRSSSAPIGFGAPPKPTVSDSEDDRLSRTTNNSVDVRVLIASNEDDVLLEDDQSSDSALLDDLLDSDSPPARRSKVQTNSGLAAARSNNVHKESSEDGSAKRLAAESLISKHRRIMTELLGMVKHEMALVNKADGDRDTIDSYMDDLESLQGKQQSLIGELRESLAEYYEASGGVPSSMSSPSKAVEVLDLLSDDDSFEDLRD